MTVSCPDADAIPKVEDAGQTREVDGQRVQVMHNGILVTEGGYYGEWTTEIIRKLRGHHEPQEERVFDEIMNRLKVDSTPPQVMIEFGAFWSYYSIWFCHVLLRSRAIAIEPDPAWLKVGSQNAALNHLTDRIHFVHAAIGDKPGEQLLFPAESDLFQGNPGHPERYVTQCDLASVLEMERLEHIDLLLADVQGAETILLERGRELFAKGAVRFLCIATHHHSISGNALTHQMALTLLTDLGAHVICEHSVSESFAGDGLIAVSFDPRDRDLVVEVSRARSKDSLFGELEYDLAESTTAHTAALHQHELSQRALDLRQAELNSMRRQLLHAQRSQAELKDQLAAVTHTGDDARSDLERIQATKLWRWSRAPRAIYTAFRPQ